jgi:hypothetical protein
MGPGQEQLAITMRVRGANARDVSQVREALKTYEEILPVRSQVLSHRLGQHHRQYGMAHTNIGAMEGNVAEFELAANSLSRPLARSPRTLAGLLGEAAECLWHDTADPRHDEADPARSQGSRSVPLGAGSAGPRHQCEQWAESQQLRLDAFGNASNKADEKLADEAIAAYRGARCLRARPSWMRCPAAWPPPFKARAS